MWKILCITSLCHLTLFTYVAAEFYVEHVKVTEFKIVPNNEFLVYNEEKEEMIFLHHIGYFKKDEMSLYYNYVYENLESEEVGSGIERLCGNLYGKNKLEAGRVHTAILQILTGDMKCPFRAFYMNSEEYEKFNVKKDFSFEFFDETDGLFINCGNSTAEVNLTGATTSGNIGRIVYNYYLTGPKCDN